MRLEPGNACIQTAAPTANPPKPADQIGPLIILYSDSLCIYCIEAAQRVASHRSHDCLGNAMGASLIDYIDYVPRIGHKIT